MSAFTSLLTALFMIAIVFAVLVILWVVVRAIGSVVVTIEKAKSVSDAGTQPGQQG